MSTSTATAYEYNVAGHLSFGAPKCEKAQKSSGFWANRTYRLCIKDNVLIDPAMGSGHILVYMFDILMQIYESQGYSQRDAAELILEKNLYGLDIDKRAYQLSYFSVMMKAREYSRRILTKGIKPHVYEIVESNNFDTSYLHYFGDYEDVGKKLINNFIDAKEYGSIIKPNLTKDDLSIIKGAIDKAIEMSDLESLESQLFTELFLDAIYPLYEQALVFEQKYDVVITNPPYLGSSGMNKQLSDFVKKNYPDSKSDLFAVFIERCGDMLVKFGYQAMITQHAWMFLTSFEKLREKIDNKNIINMAHLGPRAFEEIGGEVVQTTSFVLSLQHVKNYKGTYCRLIEPTTQQGKEIMFLEGKNRYFTSQDNFAKIPGIRIGYWFKNYNIFSNINIKDKYLSAGRMKTHNNDLYTREWWEINNRDKWRPYANGGDYRKWYGNHFDLVDFSKKAVSNYASHGGLYNQKFANKYGVTWNLITSSTTSFRLKLPEFHFSSASPTIMCKNAKNDDLYILGFCNSCVSIYLLKMFNPTLNTTVNDVLSLPLMEVDLNLKEDIMLIVKNSINSSKIDWDSFETSWDFEIHPLIRFWQLIQNTNGTIEILDRYCIDISEVSCPLEYCYLLWQAECDERFNRLKANEEELNRIFIDIYGLQDELVPEEDDEDVTVRKADLGRDIRSLISYAVGCMFGRYSLDEEGLIYAGGHFDIERYRRFEVDADNVIPITDEEYFNDDIVGRFVEFIKEVYGEDTLEQNLLLFTAV